MDSIKRLYNSKRPAHPDDAHTKAKRFFKTKGRKMVRRILKNDLLNRLSKS